MLLDDETLDITSVDSHIRRHGDLELTDTTVVDYLLDLTDDIALDPHYPQVCIRRGSKIL